MVIVCAISRKCACQKIESDLKLVTLFSVYVNTMFGLINLKDLNMVETKDVHVSVATVIRSLAYCFYNEKDVLGGTLDFGSWIKSLKYIRDLN